MEDKDEEKEIKELVEYEEEEIGDDKEKEIEDEDEEEIEEDEDEEEVKEEEAAVVMIHPEQLMTCVLCLAPPCHPAAGAPPFERHLCVAILAYCPWRSLFHFVCLFDYRS